MGVLIWPTRPEYYFNLLSIIILNLNLQFGKLSAPNSSLFIKLNLVDLNRQGKMYSQGMAPVYRVLPGKPKWDRIQDKPVHNVSFEEYLCC